MEEVCLGTGLCGVDLSLSLRGLTENLVAALESSILNL